MLHSCHIPTPRHLSKLITQTHLTQTTQATLKKNIVSGPAAGCVYYCRMGTFFFHFAPKKLFVKISSFSYKKKKGFAAVRLATISATRWTGNKLFFLRLAPQNAQNTPARVKQFTISSPARTATGVRGNKQRGFNLQTWG